MQRSAGIVRMFGITVFWPGFCAGLYLSPVIRLALNLSPARPLSGQGRHHVAFFGFLDGQARQRWSATGGRGASKMLSSMSDDFVLTRSLSRG